jgi:hypothetical protein
VTDRLGEEVTSPKSGSWFAKAVLVGVTVNVRMVAAYKGLPVRNEQRMKNKAKKRIFFFIGKNPFGLRKTI